jgi:hypothetical protein
MARLVRMAILGSAACLSMNALAAGPGEIAVHDLPQALRDQWNAMRPEMTPEGHCAVAFDGLVDPNRMVMRCSLHIRMSAEGARRALKYCEEDRERQGVRAPCRLIAR